MGFVQRPTGGVDVGLKRFVDDILSISPSYCQDCTSMYTKAVYGVKLSPAFEHRPRDCAVRWLDLELSAVGPST
eukprot:4907668-Pyramimonas_sp.AAC.1